LTEAFAAGSFEPPEEAMTIDEFIARIEATARPTAAA